MYKKIILITRKTRLQELVERFNTRSQAKFYLEQGGGDFSDYEKEDSAYQGALDVVRRSLDLGLPQQSLDRSLVPTFQFQKEDLIVTLGQDGLVANTAKYVGAQPIVALNPEPERFDGILIPFLPSQVKEVVAKVLGDKSQTRSITLAEVVLNDGQKLLAFNDLFLGPHSHTSALYRIGWRKHTELQSSSGILVATGAGSTGWVSSAFNMASGIAGLCGGKPGRPVRIGWEDPRLLFIVREPFISKHSSAGIVAGMLGPGEELTIESRMPVGGVIFSDGMVADFLKFNSGAIAHIRAAQQRAHLVVN